MYTQTKARPASIIIRPRDLMAMLSVSRHGLTRMVQDEGLPQPIQLGPRSVGFVKAEVEAWLEARKAARLGVMATQSLPIVVIRLVPEGYQVGVEPPLPDGQNRTLTFADKSNAWSYAQGLWTEHRLGLCDETIGNLLGAGSSRAPRGPYRSRGFF